MIGERQKKVIFPVVFAAAVILLLAWHASISTNYPYYFIWDMDYVTCLDTVLIQSGLLPDQICHPSFGMYFLLFFSEKIAHLSGVVSILDLDGLSASLNPLAAMAELTDFVRLHSPFLSVGIALLLCMAIQVIFKMSRWWLLFFLAFLGVQESLAYHSSMIRSELYSVFYWCGAVLMMAIAAKAGRPVKRYAALLATGLLLGLSFMTKIQSLFYLAVAPVLLLLAFSLLQDSPEQDHQKLKRKGAFWILAVSLFNAAAFLALGIASYSTPIPRGISTWAKAFQATPIVVFFFSALLLLFLFQLSLYLAKRMSSNVFRLSCFFSIIATGFILSLAFCFLLYSDAALSLQYILLNFKMVFLRVPQSSLQIPGPSAYVSNFLLYLYHNPFLFTVNIALNLLLVFGYIFRFVRITKGQLVLYLLASVIAFANIAVVTRPIFRDTLWKEALLNFLNLFYFAILANRTTRYRLTLTGIGGCLLIVLFLVNCVNAYNVPDRLDAEVNYYGWQANKFFKDVYRRNQPKYSAIMWKKYNNTTGLVAIRKAVDHKQIRRTVDFVFKNQAITHQNIGIAFKGFAAWSSDSDYRIAEVPPVLRGAILVDNASVKLKSKTFFKEEHVRKKSWYPYKFKSTGPPGRISVLTRPDLLILLFVYPDDVPNLVSEEIAQTPYKITLQNPEQSVELHGLEIKNYCEIPLDKFSQKFFFVIRQI